MGDFHDHLVGQARSTRARLVRCACGRCAALREARRRLRAERNHSYCAARGNGQPLLQDLIEANPPEGGLAAYIADLNGKSG